MRLRPYIGDHDFEYLKGWLGNERVHALWCADTIPFPLDRNTFEEVLRKNAKEWKDSAYTATDEQGLPVGFFAYNVDTADNAGFMKYIVLADGLRGKGYGSRMIALALQYAFDITGVSCVRLNVFDVNERAKNCYLRAGFRECGHLENAFSYQKETWGRTQMIIRK